jgi:hypothetical protein
MSSIGNVTAPQLDQVPNGYTLIKEALDVLLRQKNGDNARRMIEEARRCFTEVGDEIGQCHAQHFAGRIEHELGNIDAAMVMYDVALASAESLKCESIVARARHERARIFKTKYLFMEAEDGFRQAMRYYVSQSDIANIQAAINQFGDLAHGGLYHADFFLPALKKSGVPFGTPEEYLEVRSVAILSELVEDGPAHFGGRYYRERLIQKAMGRFPEDPKLANYILSEAFNVGMIRDDKEILQVAQELDRHWHFPPRAVAASAAPRRTSAVGPNKYITPGTAATSIGELYDHLTRDEPGRYAYRGQTREYPGPLMPSYFRRFFRPGGPYIERDHPMFQYSLRRIGKRFYGEYNQRFGHWVSRSLDGVAPEDRERVRAIFRQSLQDIFAVRSQIDALSLDREFLSWDAALSEALSKEEYGVYIKFKDQWRPYLDSSHRRALRQQGFIRPLGYLLGTTLAQQYGLSSEGLDVTKDPAIAAFFATHRSEEAYSRCESSGIGIIYRFPFYESAVRVRPLSDFNYYSMPTTVDLADVLNRFERERLEIGSLRTAIRCYYGATYREGLRDRDLFMLPLGAVQRSRIARQKAIIVFPDELRKDVDGEPPGIDGIIQPEFRFIEDVGQRDGVERFYFHHSGDFIEINEINRETLWPRDDPLLELIVTIVTAFYPLHSFGFDVIPHRLDLIDGAYDGDEFLLLLKELAKHDPLSLVSDAERRGFMTGTITI